MKVLGIDPGTKSLGYALLETGANNTVLLGMDDVAVSPLLDVRRTKASAMLQKIDRIVDMVMQGVMHDVPDRIVIEVPEIMSTKSGRAGAAANSGALMKVNSLVYSLRQAFIGAGWSGEGERGIQAYTVHLVSPRTWKGQQPKEVTLARMVKRYGEEVKEEAHDTVDAIAIATWAIEKADKHHWAPILGDS